MLYSPEYINFTAPRWKILAIEIRNLVQDISKLPPVRLLVNFLGYPNTFTTTRLHKRHQRRSLEEEASLLTNFNTVLSHLEFHTHHISKFHRQDGQAKD